MATKLFLILTMYLCSVLQTMSSQELAYQNGYINFGDYCYYVSKEKQNYADAVTACVNMGSNLTSIHSSDENTFLAGIVNETAWIGLYDSDSDDRFSWIDGSDLKYENWCCSEPNGDNEDCVEMYNDGTWNDNSCNENRLYICKAKALSSCADGWISYIDSCYKVLPDAKKFKTIQTSCHTMRESSYVAVPNNAMENAFLDGLTDGSIWLGCNADINHLWTCPDSSGKTFDAVTKTRYPSESYWNWDSDNGQPQTNDEYCMVLLQDIPVWHDYSCENKFIGVCEEAAIAIPPITTQPTTTVSISPTNTNSTSTTAPKTPSSATDSTPLSSSSTTSGHPLTTYAISSSESAGTPEPQAGGPAIKVIIGAVVGSLLALVIAVLLVCFLTRKRRNGKSSTPQPSKQSKPLAFDGPYNLTGDSPSTSRDDKQHFYHTPQHNGAHTKKHPVYANTNPLDSASEEVYHEVTETSTDVDQYDKTNHYPDETEVVTLHPGVETNEDDINSEQDAARPISVVYAKVEKGQRDNLPKHPQDDDYAARPISVVYAKVEKGQHDNLSNHPQDDDYEGWEDNVAYNSFEDEERKKQAEDEDTEGWEDNALYGKAGGDDDQKDQQNADEGETEGWEENRLYGDARGHDAETEGWEENQLYGDAAGSTDYQTEGWEDNVIYAGADDE